MAYICRLAMGTEPDIDLQYNPGGGWSLRDRGIQIADPEVFELWGGQREDQLVRREYGKRVIPLRLSIEEANGVDLIDSVNALEERLQHAAQYRIDGWGDEVFLELQIDDSTDTVQFPVCSGEIDKAGLYEMCGGEPDDMIDSVGVVLNCEALWEDDSTFALENYVYNPAFWRGAVAPGDSWTEDDVPGALTLAWNTTIWERMGRSLEWTIAPAGANDLGIQGDNLTVVAATEYYVEYRGYHTAGCDDITARVYDVSNGAVIAASIQVFNNGDNAWEKLGVAFTTPAGCVLVRIEVYRLLGDSTAGNKTFYCDAFLLDQRAAAPTGWCSGRNLTDELDAADQINVFCVAEIPGEVETETDLVVTYQDATYGVNEIHVAKKTHHDPQDFIWELLAVNAVVTAGDANCIDSALVGDVNAPGGQRVEVSFVGDQTMRLRCYWQITADFENYRGRYQFGVLCKKATGADTVRMKVSTLQDVVGGRQGNIVIQTVLTETAAVAWDVLDGWTIFSFPIGTHNDELWDTGNEWRIEIYADVAGAAAWDVLKIGGLYLIPVDESHLIAESPTYSGAPGGIDYHIKNLDGRPGVFPYDSTTNRYYSNIGYVASAFPSLTPEIENWFYLYWKLIGCGLVITTGTRVRVEYRPRGIFLRGTNP